METFAPFLIKIEDKEQRERVEGFLRFVLESFPDLSTRIAWNQPMFTHHGTFILGLSVAKGHIAISPEAKGMAHFRDELEKAGYQPSSMIFRIKWSQDIDHDLIRRIVAYNIEDKKDCDTFWRAKE